MSIFVVDVESDGPAAGLYSMVCFGAVKLDRALNIRFRGACAPITSNFIPESLAVSGFDRARHEGFESPALVMPQFRDWLLQHNEGKLVLLSDNNTFDGGFINYYMHAFAGGNPFGHSARRIGDFCAGLKGQWGASSEFKKLRQTAHTHDPVDDAVGNAEAFLELCDQYEVKLPGIELRSPGSSSSPDRRDGRRTL